MSAPEVMVAGLVTLDVIPELSGPLALGPGELELVGPAAVSVGGAVGNTGLALHRLRVGVRLVGRVGDDVFGAAVRDILEQAGGGLTGDIVVAAGEATSYSVVISPPGIDRSFLHCPGANEGFSPGDVPYERLAGLRLFHFGYPPLMPAMYADGGAGMSEMFRRVQEAGPATSLDLAVPDPRSDAAAADWRGVLARTLPFVDVFAPSLDELVSVLGRKGAPARGDVADLAAGLTRLGAAVVAIKLGERGLYLRTSADERRVAAFCARLGLERAEWLDREVVSPCFVAREVAGTNGSGDATIAGLLAALLRGESPEGAALAATAVGACSVEAVDPTSAIPPWPEVASRIAAGWARHPLA